MTKGVFVSYRRDDAAHITGRIHDALVARLGQKRVFMDVDSVAPGEDFVMKIRETIEASGVFIVVIGPGWLDARTAHGHRRIDLTGDFVRIELIAALSQGMKIIPVLVEGAQMPRAEELPDDVAQLVRHNAVFLSHATFRRDMDVLLAGVTGPGLLARLSSPNVPALLAGGFALTALVVAVTRSPGSAGGEAVIAGASSAISLAAGEDTSGGARYMASNGFRAERGSDGRLRIAADVPYRDRLFQDRQITGMKFMGSPFYGASVNLEVTVTNRTEAPLVIREIQFEVLSAVPDQRPLPVIREHELDYRQLIVLNEGWGPMEPVRVRIETWGLPEADQDRALRTWRGNVAVNDPCAEPSRRMPGPGVFLDSMPDTDYSRGTRFELGELVPAAFDGEQFVCATGTLQFTEGGEAQTATFRTRVSNLLPNMIAASPMILTHDLYLDPARSGYVAIVPAQFEVPAGEAVTVTIAVHTDKSSEFSLVQRLRTADGRLVQGEAFGLEVFMPKEGAVISMLNPERLAAVPAGIIAAFADAPEISLANYDPQGREPAVIELLQDMSKEECARFARHVSGRLGQVMANPEADVIVYGSQRSFLCTWPDQDQSR